jgi:putative membrane protein
MAYYWFKAFHLIGIVVWFAGLFYLVRLFIYHVEANEQPEPAARFSKISIRSWNSGCTASSLRLEC